MPISRIESSLRVIWTGTCISMLLCTWGCCYRCSPHRKKNVEKVKILFKFNIIIAGVDSHFDQFANSAVYYKLSVEQQTFIIWCWIQAFRPFTGSCLWKYWLEIETYQVTENSLHIGQSEKWSRSKELIYLSLHLRCGYFWSIVRITIFAKWMLLTILSLTYVRKQHTAVSEAKYYAFCGFVGHFRRIYHSHAHFVISFLFCN